MARLGGTIFCYNAISQDYNLAESVACLKDLCDEVIVLDAGSLDGSAELVSSFADTKTKVILLSNHEWQAQKGREKLSHFTNKAIEHLTTDFQIQLQADECIQEQSFPFIREAIETGAEGFLTRRHHLWKDPYHLLNVVQSRKPASTEIIRLAKTKYRSHDDGESLECQPFSLEYLDKIEMVHLGYVRDPVIMKAKVKHMQVDVFQMADYDKKLDLSDRFEWDHYFNSSDLIPIRKPLPKYVQQWALDRYPNITPPTFK